MRQTLYLTWPPCGYLSHPLGSHEILCNAAEVDVVALFCSLERQSAHQMFLVVVFSELVQKALVAI